MSLSKARAKLESLQSTAKGSQTSLSIKKQQETVEELKVKLEQAKENLSVTTILESESSEPSVKRKSSTEHVMSTEKVARLSQRMVHKEKDVVKMQCISISNHK